MSKTMTPRIYVETIGEVTVARIADAELVSEETIWQVSDQLGALVDGLAGSDLLVNFHEVRLMSSTMLAVLLKIARQVAKTGGRMKLCGIAPDLMDVFRITRFDRLFEIHDDEWFALHSFESGVPAAARV